MNEHEIGRLAAAAHQLRPDWPANSLRTFITKNLADRPRRDVAVALAWIACEPNTATPARVLEAGPWWRAAAVEGETHVNHVRTDPAHLCGTCSLPKVECERKWANDHAYEPNHRLKAVAVPAKEKSLIERLAEMPPFPNGTVIPFAESTTADTDVTNQEN